MKVKKSSEKVNLSKDKWGKAIEEAKEKLRRNKQQAKKIRAAIKIFECNIASGEPWPETEKAGTADAIPA